MYRIRQLLVLPLCGLAWYGWFNVFFIYSGAQRVLASPEHQSKKFLDTFFNEPLPRVMDDPWLVVKGMLVTGFLMGCVFLYLNNKLKGGWIKKGLVFGTISWALVIPWFEFYLPYNVMREPMPLMLLEAALWLGVMLCTGLSCSFLLNFRRA